MSTFTGILLGIHSVLRYLVLLAALVVIIKYAIGWLANQEYTPLDRTLKNIFVNLFFAQVVLGLLLFFVDWDMSKMAIRGEHLVTMLIAVFIAAQGARWNKIDDSKLKFRNNFIVLTVSFVFILMGIWRVAGSVLGSAIG